jgi:hypothetical protein
LVAEYDKEAMEKVIKKRWNIFKNAPIRNAGELCYVQREIVNSDPSRLDLLKKIHDKHKKLIVFYNFNYELFMMRDFLKANRIPYSEWNGHLHEPVPRSNNWVYLVQYTAGAEGWNCIKTNAIFFYSQNYSYKKKIQAEGRINRLNTQFKDLYYYYVKSKANIDRSIARAIDHKRNFNEREYEESLAV